MIFMVLLVFGVGLWVLIGLGTRAAKKNAERTAQMYGWESLKVARKALHMGPMMPYKKMEEVIRDHANAQGWGWSDGGL